MYPLGVAPKPHIKGIFKGEDRLLNIKKPSVYFKGKSLKETSFFELKFNDYFLNSAVNIYK